MCVDDSTALGGGTIELAPGVHVAQKDLRFQFSRSGGPGGQNVNKLNTKAELWLPMSNLTMLAPDAVERVRAMAGKRLTTAGEIHLTAETTRTQEGNRAEVMQKLRELLVQAMHRPKKRRNTRPSRAARERRLESKRRRGDIKAQRRSADD